MMTLRNYLLIVAALCFSAWPSFAQAQPVVVSTQLAGNPLVQYPFFEYVRAFNENAPISIAIDPTRFPTINGTPVSIYVTEARTVAQWQNDPALVDVRGEGPDMITFNGANIQGNTMTIAQPNVLSGDAGTGLGVGYDVVIDVNQNGQLDDGDYIDGFGAQAGLYVIDDINQMGPLAVTMIEYSVGPVFNIPAGFTNERTYFPTNIGSLTQRPIVIIAHGNGHQYVWYDHLGFYLASYGYVVMSLQNNTVPGIEAATNTILGHTEAFISQINTIGGGALMNRVDTSRITWIGHSRGAEAIARAYDRIFDGVYQPVNFDINDIVLLSSMLPTDFLGTNNSDPHNSNYHLWTAAADDDVDGGPLSDIGQTFHLHDRATNFRHSTVVQGAGHGDFHDGGGPSVAAGPCLIGRSQTHQILLPYMHALIKYYVDGNVPAQDFFTRQWESFHPIGAPVDPCVVVSHTFHNGSASGTYVIDDYQNQPQTDLASSGGVVTTDVDNLYEDRLDDIDQAFVWTEQDPMNGMTYGSATDTTRGVVFDWDNAERFYEISIIPNRRNFLSYEYLSFRACQTTRHPLTTAVLGDLTFSVSLRDNAGNFQRINIGAYGGGIEEPYQRIGFNVGPGPGWANEFETIRIRLTDYLHNGSNLNLANIVAVRFEFGPAFGSAQGRIGLDQIELTNDQRPFFGGIQIPVEPRGACCLPDSSCLGGLTASDCVSLSGTWTGVDTTCQTVTCGPPEEEEVDDDGVEPNVAQLQTPDGQSMLLFAPDGTTFENAAVVANPSPSDAPANVTFPVGFISFELSGVSNGGNAEIIAILPSGIVVNQFWKYGPTPDNTTPHWYEFAFDGMTGALIEGENVIKLRFVDGQRGDDDLTANGVIVEPGGPAFFSIPPSGPMMPGPMEPEPMPMPMPDACGCGNGTAATMAPALFLGVAAIRRRNRRNRSSNAEG